MYRPSQAADYFRASMHICGLKASYETKRTIFSTPYFVSTFADGVSENLVYKSVYEFVKILSNGGQCALNAIN